MIARSRLILGPAYCAFGSTKWHASGEVQADPVFENVRIDDALVGAVDEVVKGRWWSVKHRPLYYDPSVTLSLFWPWISMAATPPGTLVIATTDSTFSVVGNNGDTILLEAAGVTKMPDLFLGVTDDFYSSDMEVTGLGVSGDDPSTAASFHSISTGNSFSAPAVPDTSVLGRQKYSAAWGEFTGFTAFQGFKGFNVSHELELQRIDDNGQPSDFAVKSYRSMAKVIASGNTMANMLAAMAFSGSGAAQGQQLSAQAADLVISGASSVTVTLKNAAIKQGGFRFGTQQLRQGEIGFVSTNIAATSAGLTLA